MFGHRYFGGNYYGPKYFGPALPFVQPPKDPPGKKPPKPPPGQLKKAWLSKPNRLRRKEQRIAAQKTAYLPQEYFSPVAAKGVQSGTSGQTRERVKIVTISPLGHTSKERN